MKAEIKRLQEEVSELSNRLDNGWNYLMEVKPSDLKVEDCFLGFGWNTSGY